MCKCLSTHQTYPPTPTPQPSYGALFKVCLLTYISEFYCIQFTIRHHAVKFYSYSRSWNVNYYTERRKHLFIINGSYKKKKIIAAYRLRSVFFYKYTWETKLFSIGDNPWLARFKLLYSLLHLALKNLPPPPRCCVHVPKRWNTLETPLPSLHKVISLPSKGPYCHIQLL